MPFLYPLPIDVVRPDPDPGDPWPRHLCMPSVERHEPVGPVLRPDACHCGHTTAVPVRHHDAPPLRCPPCHGACRQGRDCPARCSSPASPMSAAPAAPPILKPAHRAMITALSFLAVYAVVAAAVALLFRDAFSTRAELALAASSPAALALMTSLTPPAQPHPPPTVSACRAGGRSMAVALPWSSTPAAA